MKKEFRWILLISGVFSILTGLYMFSKPAASLASLTLFFSIIMLINGIAESIHFFFEKDNRNGMTLFSGIITIILSLCLITSTWVGLVTFIPYMFAFWVLISGFTKLFFGFSERKNNKKDGNYLIIVGILGIVAGIFLSSHPLFTGLAVAYMIGISFVYQGISNFIIFYKLRKKV